jgi:hypothetical protein
MPQYFAKCTLISKNVDIHALLQYRMSIEESKVPSLLLALPDDCLLPILQCCAANDQRSLFSAARAHSRLHQAAVVALRSITAPVTAQHQLDSVLLYLSKHSHHIDSVEFKGDGDYRAPLRQLPQILQLSSLQLSDLEVQLLPCDGFYGVLPATAQQAALKQLRLDSCMLLGTDAGAGLAAARACSALAVLPAGLEHLSIRNLRCNGEMVQFPTAALQQLQQLSYLELTDVSVLGPSKARPVLQPLQALTRLQHVRLHSVHTDEDGGRVTAAILAGTPHLTYLELSAGLFDNEVVWNVEPSVLAGKTQLQYLHLALCSIVGGAAGISQLLCQLQRLQQLTYLNLSYCLEACNDRVQDLDSTPPAAAYAALTASSNLKQLDITGAVLPEGMWQHMFPASGRQLLHLRSLDISHVQHPGWTMAAAPEGSRLVSCCPGLQSINMEGLQYSDELLHSLQALSGLHTLHLGMFRHCEASMGIECVCQLTGLKMLRVVLPATAKESLLLQLTALKQLDTLIYRGPTGGAPGMVCLSQVGWDVGCFPCLLMIAS